MDDADAMGGGQCGGNLSSDAQRCLDRQLMFPRKPGAERLSFQKLHRQIGHARFRHTAVENTHNSRMLYRIGSTRFVKEASGDIGAAGDIGTQDLDGSTTQHAFVNGLEHHSHAATTEHTQKPMAADLLSDPRLWLWRFGLHDTSLGPYSTRHTDSASMLQGDRFRRAQKSGGASVLGHERARRVAEQPVCGMCA